MDKLDDVNTDVELLSAAIIKLQEENAYLERSLAQAQVEYILEQQYVEDMITQWDLGASQLTGLIRDNKKNDKYMIFILIIKKMFYSVNLFTSAPILDSFPSKSSYPLSR